MKLNKDVIVDGLHIFVLCGFAVAQPLFSVLADGATFFIAHHSQPFDILALVVIACVLLPATIVTLETLVGLFSRTARKGIHYAATGLLITATFLPIVHRFGLLHWAICLLSAALLGATLSVVYARRRELRMLLTAVSPATIVFPVWFLLFSPVSSILFGRAEVVEGVKVENPVPVVMVVFDEVPSTSLMDDRHEIDTARYPHFAAFAKEAIWFRNATTSHYTTNYAIPTMLTGKLCVTPKVPAVVDYPNNLFTLLADSHDLYAMETMTCLCPEEKNRAVSGPVRASKRLGSLLADCSIVYLHVLLPEDLCGGLPDISNQWNGFGGADRVASHVGDSAEAKNESQRERNKRVADHVRRTFVKSAGEDRAAKFRRFVATIRTGERPGLFFHHTLLTHAPHVYLRSGKQRTGYKSNFSTKKKGKWDDDAETPTKAWHCHLVQLEFADSMLGELVDHLKTVGIYDDALIVLVADHGVSYRPNDYRRRDSATNYPDLMPVPLLIKRPQQRDGEISERNMETIDVLPTIAHALGTDVPWEMDGCSGFDENAMERKTKVMVGFGRRTEVGAAFEEKYDALDRKLALFGTGQDPFGLYRFGPHPELVGRRVTDVGIQGTVAAEVELEQSYALAEYEPDSGLAPAYLSGTVRCPSGRRECLAVAINGTIASVVEVSPKTSGMASWATYVPETLYRPGENDVAAYVIAQIEGNLVLRSTSRAPQHSDFRMLAEGGDRAEEIVLPDGTSATVRPGERLGVLAHIRRNRNNVICKGWAANIADGCPVDAVLIFINGECRFRFNMQGDGQPSPGVSEFFNKPGLSHVRFEKALPTQWFADVDPSDVRFVAIHGTVASELKRGKNYWRLPTKSPETVAARADATSRR